ncbi:MAG: alpha/beta hydrolase [Myxococcota bacterium]
MMGSTETTGTTAVEPDVDSTTGTPEPDPSTSTTGSLDSTGAESSTGEEIELPPPLPWTDQCTYAGSDLSRLDPNLLCAGIEVPLDWDDPQGESIVIAAFKIPTTADVRRGQMWLLAGGPGSSGLPFLGATSLTEVLTEAGWDVLVPAHRGTFSPLLDCLAPPASLQCRASLEEDWGEGLRHFNSSAAGHDLAALIERERQIPGDPAVVYGVSYGTMWAMHYASLHPEQPDGVVLDSVLPAEVDVLTQESQQQAAVEVLLQRCIDDPACGPTLPYATGAEFSAAVVAAIDQGDCGGNDNGAWPDTFFRDQLGFLLNGSRRDYVPLMAALLAACTPPTSELFTASFGQLLAGASSLGPMATPAPLVEGPRFDIAPYRWGDWRDDYSVDDALFFSRELQYAVMGTTILREEQDPGPIVEAARQNLVGLGFADLFVSTHEVWTTLPDVALLPPWSPDVPALVLAGSFDLQTPLGWTDELMLGGEHQHLLVFDSANHGVLNSGNTADGAPCAQDIILAFASEPTAALDASCMDDVPQVDPALTRPDLLELSAMVFGTDDPWSLVP